MDYSPVTGYGYNLAGIAFAILVMGAPAWLALAKKLLCHLVEQQPKYEVKHHHYL